MTFCFHVIPMRSSALSRAILLTLGSALIYPAALAAQDPTESAGAAVFAGTLDPEPPFHGYAAPVPMPPKVLMGTIPAHGTPPIPIGPQRPAPDTAPVVIADPALDTGLFRYYQLEDVKPSGASTSTTGEPSVAQTDHVVFQTGNWYAARSVDNGSSWSHVSPYTFFASADNGFCCDQRIVYIPSHDITVWVLQYSYSSSTQTAGYRIAVANGSADLANTSPSAWTSYYITPSNRFGFGNRMWFDFPDIAFSNAGFYLSANVYNSSSSYQGTVIIRTTLAGLQANGTIPLSYVNSMTHGIGFSPRMAKGGNGNQIFWACLNSTSQAQIGYYNDSGSYSRVNRNIASLSTTVSSTPSPDGVNWASRAPTRFRGAFGNSSEVGFMFTSGSTGASRPHPFLRVMRFTADSARTLLGEHDIWHGDYGFAYGAAATNRQGHVGLVFAGGSASSYVSSYATIVDNHHPSWGGLTLHSMGSGQDSPNQNRWGDYFDVREHDNFTDTWVATGMRQIGGSGDGNNTPRFAWFGRDDYEPTWVNVAVQSTPISGVSITVDETDMSGSKNGSTPFNRRFTPLQPYSLTAPSTVSSGGVTYVFQRWRYIVQPGASFVNAPLGERTLSLSTVGNLDDTAEAVYVARRSLSIRSTNPSSGVSITVSPNDLNGSGNGNTSFTRQYGDSEVVTLTAPTSVGFNDFRHWTIDGSIARTGRTINVTMNGNRTVVATYWNNIAGSTATIGAGCVGSNRQVPSHTISWRSGQQGPQQGTPTNYSLRNATAAAPVAFNLGLSNRTFNSQRLPLDLGIIGITGCNLYHDIVASQALVTDTRGGTSFAITWPVDPQTIGQTYYTSYTIIDPQVRRPLPLTLSNAMSSTVGGNR